MNMKNLLLGIVLTLAAAALAASVCMNIAYPLLWNDEAETAMFGTRVLQYGYPKVHDGKNTLCHFELPDKTIAIDPRTDAYIGSGWGQFYLAALGAAFAERTGDLYAKTALIRIPFAVVGLAGVLFIAWSVVWLFGKDLTRSLAFLAAFVLLESLSAPLALHVREARHYALTIFLSAVALGIYIRYRFAGQISRLVYTVSMAATLFLLFNAFAPACAILMAAIALYELCAAVRDRELTGPFRALLPLGIALVPIAALFDFFRTFDISREFASFFPLSIKAYAQRLLATAQFFGTYDLLYAAVAAKALLIFAWIRLRRAAHADAAAQQNALAPFRRVSGFLWVFLILYIAVINRMPLYLIYSRYYMPIQPVLTAVFLIDSFALLTLAGRKLRPLIVAILGLVILAAAPARSGSLAGHLYELTHRYRGALDYAIPWLGERYPDPALRAKLVIATNYEEAAYMYYLGSRVTVGYAGNDLAGDLRENPDIVVRRKRWSYTGASLDRLIARGRFERFSFPVFDYPVNNTPETAPALAGEPAHLYKTKMAEAESDRLAILIKK